MADTYEQNLSQKGTLTVSDYIRVVGSDNASYKQLVSDVAKKIIENYTGSSLAGSSQSVKSALDALNSKITFANGISRQFITYYTNGRIQTKTYLNDNQTVYAFTISETGLSLAKSTDNEATYTTLWTK